MSSRAYHYVAVDHCPKWIEQRVAPYVFWIKGNEDDFRLRKITSIFVFLFIAIALCAVFLTIVAIAFCIHKAGGILAVDNKNYWWSSCLCSHFRPHCSFVSLICKQNHHEGKCSVFSIGVASFSL